LGPPCTATGSGRCRPCTAACFAQAVLTLCVCALQGALGPFARRPALTDLLTRTLPRPPCRALQDYNIRDYVVRHVRQDFRKNAGLSGPALAEALEMVRASCLAAAARPLPRSPLTHSTPRRLLLLSPSPLARAGRVAARASQPPGGHCRRLPARAVRHGGPARRRRQQQQQRRQRRSGRAGQQRGQRSSSSGRGASGARSCGRGRRRVHDSAA
jgi:hypothetical protein